MKQQGFTLIELMVGVALGLLATVVIAQVFVQSQSGQRTTGSGADAQVAGAMALFTVQRDVQAAGYGLTDWPAALGCPVKAVAGSGAVLNGSSDVLVPVQIAFGANAQTSDRVTVMASGSTEHSVPSKVVEAHGSSSTHFLVSSHLGLQANDLMLAVPADWAAASKTCRVFQATDVSAATRIVHGEGGTWNTQAFDSELPAGSVLLNLGAKPVRRQYEVDTATWTLQVQDLLTTAGASSTPRGMYPNIVLLKALYGKSNGTSDAVSSYSATQPTTPAQWREVRAIRLVLVARSAQFERDVDGVPVTPDAPQWPVGDLAADLPGLAPCRGNEDVQCLPLDVSASGPDNEWQRYRYKVFDTVIPLRNLVWSPA